MAVIARWRGQGVANNTTLTTTTVGTDDTAFGQVASGPVVRIETGRDRPEVRISNDATATQFRWSSLNLPTWGLRFYFRSTAHPASALASILYATQSSGRLFTITYNTTGTLGLLNAAASSVGTSPAINTSKMYRIAVSGGTTGNIDLRVFECDRYDEVGTLFWERTNQAIGSTGALTQAIFGRQSGGAYGPGYFSEFALSDSTDLIGPADTAAAVDPSTVELWWGDGSSHTRVEAWWGNGTSFNRLETHWPGEAPTVLRDPVLYPFTSESVWNTALGSEAVLGPRGSTSPGNATLAQQFRTWTDPSDSVTKRAPGQINSSEWSTFVNIAEAGAPSVTIRPVAAGTWGPKSSSYSDVVVKAPTNIVLSGETLPTRTRVNYSGAAGATGGAVTFTRISDNVNWQPDAFMSIIDREAGTVTESYKTFWAPTNPADPTATPRAPNPSGRVLVAREGVINTYSLRGDGWTTPSGRASRTGFLTGLIRSVEVDRAATDPEFAIEHALSILMHSSQLLKPSTDTFTSTHPARVKAGVLWPARAVDGHAESAYAGTIPMGMHFVLDPSFNIATSGLSNMGKALAYALRYYGGYVTDIAAYSPTLCVEQSANAALTAQMKADWQSTLMLWMVPVMNNSAEAIGGPGTRLRPPRPPLS